MTHPDWQVLVLSRYGSSQQVVAHAQFKCHICTQTSHAWVLVAYCGLQLQLEREGIRYTEDDQAHRLIKHKIDDEPT